MKLEKDMESTKYELHPYRYVILKLINICEQTEEAVLGIYFSCCLFKFLKTNQPSCNVAGKTV